LWLESKAPKDNSSRSQRKLQRIIDLLEEGIGRDVVLAEPNYLTLAYRILELSLRKEGKYYEAELLAEKAHPYYIQKLVEKGLRALKDDSA
jgi:hypothetical protein